MNSRQDGGTSPESLSENAEALLRHENRDISNETEVVGSVLIVDDDAEVLEVLKDTVEAFGYNVLASADPEEARSIFEDQRTPLSCVIADFHMPKKDGLEMLKEVKKFQPNASFVLLSGQADFPMALKAINSGSIFRFMVKPVRSEELQQVLEDSVKQYQLIEKERRLQKNVYELALSLKQANERLERNLDQIIGVYSDVVGTFSPYLIEVDRVTRGFCKSLCRLGIFSEKEARILTLAANFHNLGLLGISRNTIKTSFHKEAELTEAERARIEAHPKVGASMIDFLGESRQVSDVILAHHERWDGDGYPNGLRGDMIPRLSQFLSLATFYSESRYSGDNLIYRVRKERGRCFGPEVMSAFDTLVDNDALPPKVQELGPEDLYSGMLLVRDVLTSDGSLLIAQGTIVSVSHLRQIRMRAEDDSLELPIYAKNVAQSLASGGRG